MCPCKDCIKRHIGCHIDCEDYIQWKEDYEKHKQKIKSSKLGSTMRYVYVLEQKTKQRKAHNN